jgi:DNA-binding MarR family transcriptional regulator
LEVVVDGGPVDLGVLMALAYGNFVSELREHLAEQGFNDLGRSFGYIARMLDEREANVSEVAEMLGVSNQAAVKVLHQLDAAGYVRRIADRVDGRMRRLELTTRGRETLAAARAFHRAYEERLVERVGARRAAQFRSVLTLLSEAGDTARTASQLRPM